MLLSMHLFNSVCISPYFTCAEFNLSEKQAEALLDITLRKLTSLEVSVIGFYYLNNYLIKFTDSRFELNGPLLFCSGKNMLMKLILCLGKFLS
jgi:hypothetical protein